MVIGAGGPYQQPTLGTATELLATYFPIDPITPGLIVQQANGAYTPCTAAELHDGSDLTGWLLTVSGDGAQAGNAVVDGIFSVGDHLQIQPVGSIDFLRVTMRAEVTGNPGSTAVIYGFRRGSFLPTNILPDDYLSAPIGALANISYDYPNDVTGLPWILVDVYTQAWGFRLNLQNFDVSDANVIHLYEWKVDIYGKRLIQP